MKISAEKLTAEAESTGFRPDIPKKVAHLLGLLNTLHQHPFLQEKPVFKGGTALREIKVQKNCIDEWEQNRFNPQWEECDKPALIKWI